MNLIEAREMFEWEQERKANLLSWMVFQGYDPRDAASLQLEDDGTATVTLFMHDEDGRRRIDPNDGERVLTVEINFTPTTPCPEPHSGG